MSTRVETKLLPQPYGEQTEAGQIRVMGSTVQSGGSGELAQPGHQLGPKPPTPGHILTGADLGLRPLGPRP